jgi:hypothetical protein
MLHAFHKTYIISGSEARDTDVTPASQVLSSTISDFRKLKLKSLQHPAVA